MRISKIGGVIAAASQRVAQPLLQIGTIPIIRRIVISYQQAGIFPIVVVTGAAEAEVRHELSGLGVIFLPNEEAEHPELMESVRIGLRYLQGKCDRIAFTPVNVPMFTPDTLSALIRKEGSIVIPSYHGKGGHPVLLDKSVIPQILDYQSENGLRGAMQACDAGRTWLEVEDRGILTNVNNAEELEVQCKIHNTSILHPTVSMKLEREMPFFTPRLKLLLYLIADTENMRVSFAYSGIPHSKAWEMINTLEENVGYQVVKRFRGGRTGGSTKLTARGKELLLAYQSFEEKMQEVALEEFQNRFICTKIL